MFLEFIQNYLCCCFFIKSKPTSLLDAEFEHYVVYNDRFDKL